MRLFFVHTYKNWMRINFCISFSKPLLYSKDSYIITLPQLSNLFVENNHVNPSTNEITYPNCPPQLLPGRPSQAQGSHRISRWNQQNSRYFLSLIKATAWLSWKSSMMPTLTKPSSKQLSSSLRTQLRETGKLKSLKSSQKKNNKSNKLSP